MDANASIKFEKTQLHSLFDKDLEQRTEGDFKELRNILLELDFIKNHELDFVSQDLTEMAKSAKLIACDAGQNLFKQYTETTEMFLILQGRAMATYSLASKDKKALYFGQKDIAADGMIKTLKTLHIVKNTVEQALEDNKQASENSSFDAQSGSSKVSRGSRASQFRRQRNIGGGGAS